MHAGRPVSTAPLPRERVREALSGRCSLPPSRLADPSSVAWRPPAASPPDPPSVTSSGALADSRRYRPVPTVPPWFPVADSRGGCGLLGRLWRMTVGSTDETSFPPLGRYQPEGDLEGDAVEPLAALKRERRPCSGSRGSSPRCSLDGFDGSVRPATILDHSAQPRVTLAHPGWPATLTSRTESSLEDRLALERREAAQWSRPARSFGRDLRHFGQHRCEPHPGFVFDRRSKEPRSRAWAGSTESW